MSIKVRTTADGQSLVITDLNESHNHNVSKVYIQVNIHPFTFLMFKVIDAINHKLITVSRHL